MMIQIDMPDLRGAIVARPWGAMALAFGAGACLALLEPRGRIARTITSTLGAIAAAALRDGAGRWFAAHPGSWIDNRARTADAVS